MDAMEGLQPKFKGFPATVWDITFDKFCQVYKYQHIQHIAFLLSEISDKPLRKVIKMKLTDAYPLFKHYTTELKQVDKMLKDINEEMPVPKKIPPKDFNEFGFRNIINAVAQGKKELHEYFYKQTVAEIYVMYRMHCQETINFNYDTNTK